MGVCNVIGARPAWAAREAELLGAFAQISLVDLRGKAKAFKARKSALVIAGMLHEHLEPIMGGVTPWRPIKKRLHGRDLPAAA